MAYQTETNIVRFRSSTARRAMRESAHNILYRTVNSRAYEPVNYEKATPTPVWRTVLIVLDVIAAAAFIGLDIWFSRATRSRGLSHTFSPTTYKKNRPARLRTGDGRGRVLRFCAENSPPL